MADYSFNTQPPEGGWKGDVGKACGGQSFNTQPPEGGWLGSLCKMLFICLVSTHSRPKAAGF